ncbi:hypothetical protein GOP47_0006087 [Adiantum capillus-veneris]|uniref:TauD/TfdA-like domain-containing protein n=1 Tax=Adiantum capillus-veneris TaxID=13818 RepID=A0A9D4ZM77_ADICA|nr:hypothetical protein GOP47_0006087 [Adiantum capillus-veneris]
MDMAGEAIEGEAAGYSSLAEACLPEQRMVDGKAFPLVITPSSPLESAIVACKLFHTSRAFLEQKLKDNGAVFLRGFPLRSGFDFHGAVEALGWHTLPYIGSGIRTQVVGSVYTANDSGPDVVISFHHEMAQVVDALSWPSKVLFFCETPSSEGGETSMIMSHKVTQGLWMQCPEFMQKVEDLGLLYLKVLPMVKDPKYLTVQDWPTVFGTSDKKEAEERAKKNFNGKVEWLPGGNMNLVTGPFKATRNFGREERANAWFNQIAVYHTGLSHKGGMPPDQPYDVVFGDGSPLPANAVATCKKIHEENSVDIPWKQGDLMILDNSSVMHGRRAYKPPRKILVTLCK